MRIWIDVENPPQVQYLMPLEDGFRSAGAEVVVTARDYGETYSLLRARGSSFLSIGSSYGSGKLRKIAGLARRTRALRRALKDEPPDAVVHAGRAAAFAARTMGAASFAICDYEFSNLTADRLAGSFILFPEAIGTEAFRRQGFREEQLLPFSGLKEDLTFADLDVAAVAPHAFEPEPDPRLVRFLVRPAAEESHYYRPESGEITLELLRFLARQEDAVVVFAPRYPRQAEYLKSLDWTVQPLLLERAIPFVALLKAVDAVVSSGGTMIREAAYLGVPAYSTFRGRQGAVDRHLEATGRLRPIRSRSDFEKLELRRRPAAGLLRSNPRLVEELVEVVLRRSNRRREKRRS